MSKIKILPFVRKGLASYINEVDASCTDNHASITVNLEFTGLKPLRDKDANTPEPLDPANYLNVDFDVVEEKDGSEVKQTTAVVTGKSAELDIATSKVSMGRKFFLTGPGEIQTINASAISRVSPTVGSEPMASTFMPYIEFYDTDFPWRYTPLKEQPIASSTDKQLCPWVALIACEVAEADRGFKIESFGGRNFLTLTDNLAKQALPAYKELYNLAHAQREIEGNEVIGECSRLFCNSPLKENTEYVAFLIPTFKLGLKDVNGNATIRDMAWSEDKKPAGEFPIYYQWKFTTGAADFKTLAEMLTPVTPAEYDQLPDKIKVDVRDAGVEYMHKVDERKVETLTKASTSDDFGVMPMAVAMKKPGDSKEKPTTATKILLEAEEAALKDLIEKSPVFAVNARDKGNVAAMDEEDPWVVPPVYAGRQMLSEAKELDNKNSLLSELNLDLENRAAAGLGATVVQDNQEDFVHRAWLQVEDIIFQNKIIRELAAINQADQVTQRRVRKYRKAKISAKQDAIKKDIAMRIATRAKRYVGAEAIQKICADPDTIVEKMLSKPEAEDRPGIKFSALQMLLSRDFWDGKLTNHTKDELAKYLLRCTPLYQSEKNWFRTLFPDIPEFQSLSKMLSVKLVVTGTEDNRNSAYRFVLDDEFVKNFISLEEAKKINPYAAPLLNSTILDVVFGAWSYNCYTNDKLQSIIECLKNYHNLNNLAGIKSYIDGDDSQYCATVPHNVYVALKGELNKRGVKLGEDDICRLVFTPKSANGARYNFNAQAVMNIVDITDPRLKFYCMDQPLTYVKEGEEGYFDFKGEFRVPSTNGESDGHFYKINIENGVLGLGATKNTHKVCEEYINKLNYTNLQIIHNKISPKYKKSFLLSVKIGDDNYEPIMCYVPKESMPEKLEYLTDKIQFINRFRDVLTTTKEYIDQIAKYFIIPSYAVFEAQPTGELYNCMDVLNTEKDNFGDVVSALIDNLVNIPNDKNNGQVYCELNDLYELGTSSKEEKDEPTSPIPDFATEQNQKKLEEILNKYANGGRTPEQLAERLWEIANLKYPIMAYPEYFDPTVFYLRQMSTRFILATSDQLREDSISMFESNPKFEEAFLAGMNTEMGKELMWREYPSDERGSYFRKFWDKLDLPDCVDDYFDIKEMHLWNGKLGKNHRAGVDTLVVFVVKGKLLRAYPNTAVSIMQYANGKFDQNTRISPEMTTWLTNDTYIIGFPKNIILGIKAQIAKGEVYCLCFEEQPQGLQFTLKINEQISQGRSDVGAHNFATNRVYGATIWGAPIGGLIKDVK